MKNQTTGPEDPREEVGVPTMDSSLKTISFEDAAAGLTTYGERLDGVLTTQRDVQAEGGLI